jgi:hypothetical protein
MRVLNKKYWPYQYEMEKATTYITDVDPRERWCYDNLKSRNWKCYGWNPVTYAFKRSDDAILFKLMFK